MDIEKQLEVAAQSDHLVLIVFYAATSNCFSISILLHYYIY